MGILYVVLAILVLNLLWLARIEWLLRQSRDKASEQETSIESQLKGVHGKKPNRMIII